MRIVIHDYSGHPFQVQLSRELARRGHIVRHIYSSSFQTPKGNLVRSADDPEGFDIQPVTLSATFAKGTFLKRRSQEIETGRLVARALREFHPEVVISSNAPLDTQRVIMAETRRLGAKFIFWLQDIYSEAIRKLLPRKLPGIGHIVAPYYQQLEFDMLRKSDHVVSITHDFLSLLASRGVRRDRITVIENWAPLDEITPISRDNPWSDEHMPEPGLRVVYSGTLGYKHKPALLIDIARAIDGHVYIFSEGVAAQRLAQDAIAMGVQNISVRGWVPFSDLSKMLSAADIFVAMIEEDAGIFSVPSKVLSYLCVGRPIVASIPEGNLARKIILREDAGLVASPSDPGSLIDQIRIVAADPGRRKVMADNARAYATRTFDISRIGDAFEELVVGSVEAHGRSQIPGLIELQANG